MERMVTGAGPNCRMAWSRVATVSTAHRVPAIHPRRFGAARHRTTPGRVLSTAGLDAQGPTGRDPHGPSYRVLIQLGAQDRVEEPRLVGAVQAVAPYWT